MNASGTILLATLILGTTLLAACAQHPGAAAVDRAATIPGGPVHAASPSDTETIVANTPIPNLPGKRLISLVVDYPPGGVSTPHRHAPSAFIYAHVISGRIRSQVDDQPVRVYRAGETWLESPGSHHRVSANASATEPARLLAVFIVDEADERMTIPDAQ